MSNMNASVEMNGFVNSSHDSNGCKADNNVGQCHNGNSLDSDVFVGVLVVVTVAPLMSLRLWRR